MQIPVVTTLMGKAAIPCSNPLNLGPVGMHGSKYANMAVTESDLIIACGARFSDRVTGKVSEFAPHAKIIHIDIDPAEIGKIVNPNVPIVGDVKVVLAAVNERLEKMGAQPASPRRGATRYSAGASAGRSTPPTSPTTTGKIAPEVLLETLSDKLDPARIHRDHGGRPAPDVGPPVHPPRARAAPSSPRGGLGTMGFGFPAAIGATDRRARTSRSSASPATAPSR